MVLSCNREVEDPLGGFSGRGNRSKVSLGVAKDEAREVGKCWSTEDLEFHLVNIHFLLFFISILILNLLKK